MFVQVDQLHPHDSLESVALALTNNHGKDAFSLLITTAISRATLQEIDHDTIHDIVDAIINVTVAGLQAKDHVIH